MINADESLRCCLRQRRFWLGSLAVALQASLRTVPDGGRVAFARMPGEIFAERGQVLKPRSPFRYTISHAIANGGTGYVPSSQALSEDSCGAHCAIIHNPNRR